MFAMLLDPAFVLGLAVGFGGGALATCGLIFCGFRAKERLTRLETERTQVRIRAAESARAWGDAANDDRARTTRSLMRGGAR